jgi:serine/threonine protein kinase
MGEEGVSLDGIPREGEVIAGKFVVERVLGIGGMGAVVAARHMHLGQRVAVKFLLPEAAEEKDAVERFLREARAAVGLQSAHVVRVSDVGTLDNGLPYMLMEFLSGHDLSKLLEQRGPLPVQETVDYILQACEAIAEAHGIGLVHRDLKPGNLFVTARPDGSPLVKVLDFGISKAIDPTSMEKSLTKTSSIMGSPLYMSPEQLRSAKRVDTRTDIWAIGVILYELSSGGMPFDDETMTAVCAKIVADPPVPLRERRPSVPPGFEAVVMRCLEKDLAKRYQTVGELAAALRPFASAEGALSADRVSRIGRPSLASVPSAPQIRAASASAQETQTSAGRGGVALAETVANWQTGSSQRGKRTRTVALAAVGVGLAVAVGAVVVRTMSRGASAAAGGASAVVQAAPPTTPAAPDTAVAATTTAATATPPPASAAATTTAAVAATAPAARPGARPTVPPPPAATAAPAATPAATPAAATTTAPPKKPSSDDLLLDRK